MHYQPDSDEPSETQEKALKVTISQDWVYLPDDEYFYLLKDIIILLDVDNYVWKPPLDKPNYKNFWGK